MFPLSLRRPGVAALLFLPLPLLGAQVTGLSPAFVENRGQWPAELRMGSRQGGITSWFTQNGVHLLLEELPKGWDQALIRHKGWRAAKAGASGAAKSQTLRGHALFLRPLGRSSQSHLEATGATLGLRHEFRVRRVRDIPRREGLRYRGVWPGVDLDFGHAHGRLAYALSLAPKVDLERVVFALEGASRLWIGGQGRLHAQTSLGELLQSSPRAFVADARGRERELPARFVLLGENRFGFDVDGWTGEGPLRIDPGIRWAGYVGGSAYDGFNAVCQRGNQDLVAVGFAYSWNFPVTAGAYQGKLAGGSDVVVVKRGAQGQKPLWATYIGGSGRESAFMVDCDARGRVVLGGWTASLNFPVSKTTLQARPGGGATDAFVCQLDAAGRNLLFSTYLGGNLGDQIYGLQLDQKGRVYVCGETSSSNFPITKNSFGGVAKGRLDAFVSQVDLGTGKLLFSGRVGGPGLDGATNLSLDERRGRVFVCGTTLGSGFPASTWAFQRKYGGGLFVGDVFVMTLALTGKSVLASSLLGGGGDDTAWAIDVDPQGNAVLAGETFSTRFPVTKGVVMPKAPGLGDAFVARMTPLLNLLPMSTFFGGGLADAALGIDVQEDGKILISGSTWSNGSLLTMPFPTTAGAFRRKHAGQEDAFLVRLDALGRWPLYSSLYGGSGREWFYTDARNRGSDVPVAGISLSSNFPHSKTGSAYRGKGDGLLALLDPLPLGATLGGAATRTCAGEPTLLPATWPKNGTNNFLLLAGAAPPKRPGLLLLGSAHGKPIRFAGAEIWLNLALPVLPFALLSNARGEAQARLSLPPVKGLVASLQLFWFEPATCSRPISATRYLRLSLQ